MQPDPPALLRLRRLWQDYQVEPFPREPDGVDEDLYSRFIHEDASLAGRVSTFLDNVESGRPPLSGSMNVPFLSLDSSTDDALVDGRPTTARDRERLEELRAQRRAMIELAETLSEASGLPLVRRDERDLWG